MRNSGMINLVYSYSKGAEVLKSALSGMVANVRLCAGIFLLDYGGGGTVLLGRSHGKTSPGGHTALWTAAL